MRAIAINRVKNGSHKKYSFYLKRTFLFLRQLPKKLLRLLFIMIITTSSRETLGQFVTRVWVSGVWL